MRKVRGGGNGKCQACGLHKLVRATRDLPYTYKGETTTIAKVKGEYCPACGEAVLGPAESARTSAAMLAFNKEVNATIVDPGFIAKVRKKLALDQKQAADIFGGGVNAFSRYETGKTKPPRALVQLLRILDRHPEQLDELRL
jgi:HTH-type transcriptional regulator/antitoxin MqsA